MVTRSAAAGFLIRMLVGDAGSGVLNIPNGGLVTMPINA
jgi:T5SS/PEP-CTERM-associated repeat protein